MLLSSLIKSSSSYTIFEILPPHLQGYCYGFGYGYGLQFRNLCTLYRVFHLATSRATPSRFLTFTHLYNSDGRTSFPLPSRIDANEENRVTCLKLLSHLSLHLI